MDSEQTERPVSIEHNCDFIKLILARHTQNLKDLQSHMNKATKELDAAHNKYFGALFRSGSKQTFFSMQVKTHPCY